MDIFLLYIVLQTLCSVDWAVGLRLLELSVPRLADPRSTMELGCRWDLGLEELNSVKWYKDEQEFFRYTPRQQPHVLSFPVAGVHLSPGVDQCKGSASVLHQCTVQLHQLSTAHSTGSYRCEVSTEAPAFRVVFDAANVTVAALAQEGPSLTGLQPTYSVGDLVQANCTAQPQDPPPTLTITVNGTPAPSHAQGPTINSRPDPLHGLVTTSLTVRFFAERRHFTDSDTDTDTNTATMKLACILTTPAIPAAPRLQTTRTAKLLPDRNAQLSNQKLAWPSNTAQRLQEDFWFTILASVLFTKWKFFS